MAVLTLSDEAKQRLDALPPIAKKLCAQFALLRDVAAVPDAVNAKAVQDLRSRLVVELPGGGRTALDAGEVHLGSTLTGR